jgi:NADH-quinone oxidoreductase subunit L
MKITAATCWIGALALIGTPFFSGFYSKDALIEAAHASQRWGATYAYWCVTIGVFVTAFYTFRMIFMTFHGKPRFETAAAHHGHDDHAPEAHGAHDDHGHHGGTPHESPWVVWLPLVLLAIPSVIIGAMTLQPLLFGGGFGDSIFVLEKNDVVAEVGQMFHGWASFALHSWAHAPLWLAAFGVFCAWAMYIKWPHLPDVIDSKLKPLRWVLEHKYGFDAFNEKIIAPFSRLLGKIFWKGGDEGIIETGVVNFSANSIGFIAGIVRRVQSGFLYSYAFWMVIGLAAMLGWFLTRA